MQNRDCKIQQSPADTVCLRGAAALDRFCPPQVTALLALFSSYGERAYLVGGCVRDALMGRMPHDWDVAVTTPPERTEAICRSADLRTVPTGVSHGTVTVLLPPDFPWNKPCQSSTQGNALPVECTTCRTEGGYSDGRHPDTVTFTGRIQDDLSRRDFTINAMAAALIQDPGPADTLPRDDLSRRDFTVNAMAAALESNRHFAVIDLFGGREDLIAGVIRCVGDPTERLTEDALRILRAVRFAVKLGLQPDPTLAAAVPAVASGLARISRERISSEFLQILCSPAPERGMHLLADWGLFPYILPCGTGLYDETTSSGSSDPATGRDHDRVPIPPDTGCLSALPPDVPVRLACLLWRQSTENALSNLQSLRLPTATVRQTMAIHDSRNACVSSGRNAATDSAPLLATPRVARRLRNRLGALTCDALAVRAARGEDTSALLEMVRQSEAQRDPVCLADLAVTGRDLAEAGIPAGRETGRVLHSLLEAVLDDPQSNTRAILLAMANKYRLDGE